MQEESILMSLRIPKTMDRDIGVAVKTGGYASRTELVREALRDRLYRKKALKGVQEMRGALKGKVKVTGTMSQWRKKQWQNALKKANGDPYKASEIMENDEKEAIKGLRL